MQKIPLSVLYLQGDGYHILMEVELLDRTFHMVVDTGASKTVLDRNMLLQSGIDESTFQHTDILSTGLGTNTMQSYILYLPYLKIGAWQTKKLQVAVLDLSTINHVYEQMNFPKIVGVLGGDILLQFGAVINYKTKTLQLNVRRKTDKV